MKIRTSLACLTLFILSSCTNDKLEPSEDISCNTSDIVTYDLQIKPIIDASCAGAGCHDGNGEGPGDYNSYAGMQAAIDDDLIFNRVITSRNDGARMPPIEATPLTTENLILIQCWANDGYPEN
ncbi:MAG: hypothetical protein ACI94Y_001978 [Maribacter sp.]|jgi:hypothetical protein